MSKIFTDLSNTKIEPQKPADENAIGIARPRPLRPPILLQFEQQQQHLAAETMATKKIPSGMPMIIPEGGFLMHSGEMVLNKLILFINGGGGQCYGHIKIIKR
jgi:hypothetical protein